MTRWQKGLKAISLIADATKRETRSIKDDEAAAGEGPSCFFFFSFFLFPVSGQFKRHGDGDEGAAAWY